jgi:hypothetical protein
VDLVEAVAHRGDLALGRVASLVAALGVVHRAGAEMERAADPRRADGHGPGEELLAELVEEARERCVGERPLEAML